MDIETREQAGRASRLAALTEDHADWTRRQANASRRIEGLAADRAKAEAALEAARETPEALAGRREKMLDELSIAEARQAKAGDALAVAKSIRVERPPGQPQRRRPRWPKPASAAPPSARIWKRRRSGWARSPRP